MKITKEKLLMTALNLFSKYGYDGVSISYLANELGVTKGAIYRHYESKQAIFDEIIQRVVKNDKDVAIKNDLPTEREGEYFVSSLDDFISFTLDQFSFYAIDEFGSAFRKMVMLEQFRNIDMIELYRSIFLTGPIEYTAKVFKSLINDKKLKGSDAEQMAREYYSSFFMYLSLSDYTSDKIKLIQELKDQLLIFKRNHGG